jgi:peroxiredoxin
MFGGPATSDACGRRQPEETTKRQDSRELSSSWRPWPSENIAYVMESIDTLEDNTNFAKEHDADFPILADPSKDTAKICGVIRTDLPPERQVAQRWTFYIGPDGKILAIDKNPTTARWW